MVHPQKNRVKNIQYYFLFLKVQERRKNQQKLLIDYMKRSISPANKCLEEQEIEPDERKYTFVVAGNCFKTFAVIPGKCFFCAFANAYIINIKSR
jgi:hypothetical protein